ncbi:PorV/PorQ family protein [Candidatus Poribacteria bacterium]
MLDFKLPFSQIRNRKSEIANILRLASCVFLMACLILPAQGRGPGTSGSTALKIGIGARSTGMGEASVAVAGDVSSIYWNPAGLFQIQGSQLSAMHMEWLDDIRYEWVGYAQPLASWGTIAADVSYVHMGDIVRTLESATEGYEENGIVTAADVAGRVAFASKVYRGVVVGASFQMLQSKVDFENVTKERMDDRTAKSTAIGIGVLYDTPVPNLSAGCSFQNLGSQTEAFISKKEPLPFAFRMGAAYKTVVRGWKSEQPKEEETEEPIDSDVNLDRTPGTLVAAMDLDFPADNSPGIRMGLEYQFGNGIAVRGGYRTGTGLDFSDGFSGGMGYTTATYQVNYALVPYGDIGNTHRISFTIRF